ncbi:hypothetical protein [Parafrankia sp. EUN1f]|uniref:hypothetical protein n=1 Tax=Parafrankia sp. EUN1f TaxID=102897 RepID=UPI0001C44B15|nr:hypothetical protein [Parafrankia sp. EUN1f]EFC82481.1 hypothetical protein FrEUN1fDRAFT_4415 [Parafrankia sp. EUN1f]
MKFRTLGVALVAGGGLALAALPASPATAFDDKDKPYPPVSCSGDSGEGHVTKSLLLLGENTTFSGCGFRPNTSVNIQIDGVTTITAPVNGSGRFSQVVTPTTAGTHILSGVGLAGGPPTVGPGADDESFDAAGGDTFADPGDDGFDEGFDDAATAPEDDLPFDSAPFGGPAVGGPAVDVPPATDDVQPPAAVDSATESPDGLAAVVHPGWKTRVVTAKITVIGFGQGGIDPIVAADLISDWVRWGLDRNDKDRFRDGNGSCFGDGFDKDRNRDFDKDRDKDRGKDFDDKNIRNDKDFNDRDRVHRNGLAAPVVTPLADGDKDDRFNDKHDRFNDKDDRFNDKDDRFNDKDDRFNDKDRRRDGDCIIAGGVVGVGVGGAGVGGAGVGTGAGALPFTGVETGAMMSIAIALLGGGVLLRVAARRRRLAGRVQG